MLKKNFDDVNARIKNAAEKSGRKFEDILLVAATKTVDVPVIKQAISYGVKVFGENRVQEADRKFMQLPEVEKHMIGHLQTNKAKFAVKIFDMIQSVDTLKLAKEIDKRALDAGRIMPVLIEVNCGEDTKYGLPLGEVASFYDKLLKLQNIKVQGLMTIAPFLPAEETRPYFKKMKKLFDELNLKYLSMGMSNDFEVAIEEGSNMVRLGSALFGERKS